MSSSSPLSPGVSSFHEFLTQEPILSTLPCFSTRLLTSRRSESKSPTSNKRLAIVVDAEHCLDRLYGGYYSDWSSGGQWSNCYTFLSRLFSVLSAHNVHLTLFFDGSFMNARRRQQWITNQLRHKQNVDHVLRHVQRKATPPPKAWWIPPSALHTSLRMALKCLNVTVLNSSDEHKLEVMHFCWENHYHALAADDGGEYAMFNPPALLSAHELKLSFQMEVSTSELKLDDVARVLDVNPNRFCLLATLMGNHIVKAGELTTFHQKLAPQYKDDPKQFDRVIRALIKYIRTLSKVDDYVTLARDVFGIEDSSAIEHDGRMVRLAKSIEYYISGSQQGHANKRPKVSKKMKQNLNEEVNVSEQESNKDSLERLTQSVEDWDLNCMDEKSGEGSREVVLDDERRNGEGRGHDCDDDHDHDSDLNDDGDGETCDVPHSNNAKSNKATGSRQNVYQASNGDGSKRLSVVQALAKGIDVEPAEDGRYPSKSSTTTATTLGESSVQKPKPSIPKIHSDILRKAKERHRQAQMSPYVLHLLTRGQIWLPVVLEEFNGQSPPVHKLLQGLRQRIYAVLFNLHHHKFARKKAQETVKALRRKGDDLRCRAKRMSEGETESKKELLSKADSLFKQASETKLPELDNISVLEHMPYDDYQCPEQVQAVELGWSVPTVQRLWFGNSMDDKEFRLRAFLSCLMCDQNSSLLLSPSNVPQHLLIVACVLRYLMCTTGLSLLKKFELDAFIVVALSENELSNSHFLSEITLVNEVTKRGLQLGSIFMNAIDMALLANDVCGMPLPAYMCFPWRFFDGKLFHKTLLRAQKCTSLFELCQGNMQMVQGVERMRGAIVHGLMPVTNPGFVGVPQWGQAHHNGQQQQFGMQHKKKFPKKGGKGGGKSES